MFLKCVCSGVRPSAESKKAAVADATRKATEAAEQGAEHAQHNLDGFRMIACGGLAAMGPDLLALVEEDRAQFIEEYKNLRALLVEPDATKEQIEDQRFVVFSGISALNELLRTAGMKSWGGGVNSLLSEVRTTVDDDRFDEHFHTIASDVESPAWQTQLKKIAQVGGSRSAHVGFVF